MNKIISNFVYQSVFQVCKIILPIMTMPIISRALGIEGIGTYNYSSSIVQYFVLFGSLGVEIYASREIAIVRDSIEDRSRVFFEILGIKLFFTMITIIIYAFFMYSQDFSIIYIILFFMILANIFDITWFFMGIEDFQKTSMINLFVQIIAFICIILFVKEPKDLFLYALIQSMSVFMGSILTWIFVKKKLVFVPLRELNYVKHIPSVLIYFIPKVSIILYTNLNKTMLGIFDSVDSVGIYSNSVALNTVFVTFLTTLDLVLMPRMSNLYAKKNTLKMNEIMKNSIHFQLYFSIAIMCGVWTVYDKFVPWFFGAEFILVNKYVPILSVLIVIIPLGMGIARQYLLPMNKIKTYNIAVIMGAAISVVINIFLIPIIGVYGAVIASVVSEFFVSYIRTRSFVKDTGFRFDMKQVLIDIGSGLFMMIAIRNISKNMSISPSTTLLQMILGIFIYLLLTSLLGGNPIINYRKK